MATIGLLSDSHGRSARTRQAVKLLLAHKPDVIVHLGDVGGEPVIDALIESVDNDGQLDPPVHIVSGNTDYDWSDVSRYARRLGVSVDDEAGRLTLDGKTVVFTHGDRGGLMQQAIDEGVDYLLHGHTHRRADAHVGRTRVINPGALHRAADYTVALLDVADDRLQFVQVPAQ